jgi:hypothetical protein
MDKLLKEIVDPTSGVSMVVPKTSKAAYLMDAAGRVTRHVEPPITPAMKTDLATPINKAKLDHGVRTEQYRTSNLIKKDDAEIELITKDAEGRFVVKPVQFQSIDQTPLAAKAARNLDRQGIPQAEMEAFVKEKTAQWDAAVKEKADLQIGTKGASTAESKRNWMKNQILAELKRRGAC